MMQSIAGLSTTKGNVEHQTTKSESGPLAHIAVFAHNERNGRKSGGGVCEVLFRLGGGVTMRAETNSNDFGVFGIN